MAISERAQTQPETRDRAYNLFRNKQRPDLVCAVPEDYPVPSFLVEEGWVFARPLRPLDLPPPGFHARAAAAGVRYNGFYVFHDLMSGAGRSARHAA
jgi:hypothetical protein